MIPKHIDDKWIPLWFYEEDKDFGEPPSDYKRPVCGNIYPAKTVERYCPHCGADNVEGEMA